MPIDLNTCDTDCVSCVKKYIKKHSLKKGQKFKIACKGIPEGHAPLHVLNNLPEEQHQMARSVFDPVTWAADTIDWHCLDPDGEIWKRKNPVEYYDFIEEHGIENIYGRSRYHRPYQATMLRCTAQQKVFRIGRQAGKCLVSGTLIQMADGTQKPVEEVQDGDLVVSVNDNYKSVINKAYRACNGEKPSYRITLMDGRQIEATGNHPFLSRKNISHETTGNKHAIFHDEWIEVEQLTKDNYLAVPSNIQINADNADIPECALTVLGCLIADGDLTDQNYRFSNGNQVILNSFREGVKNLGCSLKQYSSDQSKYNFHIVAQGSSKRHPIKDWLRGLKLQGLDSHQKFIPDTVMSMNNTSIASLLKAMFGCNGWVSISSDKSVEIGYSTVSEALSSQIISLLARFGIYASCQNKTIKLNGNKFYSKQITITKKRSIANFYKYIGILGKEEQVKKAYEFSRSEKLSPETEFYEDNDITFIPVRSVEYIGKKMTWDLTVPDTHNFIANNIITHNTETLVVSMLYHLFTKPGLPENEGYKIILITPFQSQIDLIFTRMNELITNSPILKNSIKRNVKAPIYQTELYNRSTVKGFTAGTKSGGDAASVRGQTGHMLVFDEADYLNAGDMDAAMSIITNYPNATVWMSSTPSGKREKFYENCNSQLWKEYYFPSNVNPLWNEQKEESFREQLTEIGYKHEILADFGEQEEGVFQNNYVQAAKLDYKYGDFQWNRDWQYTIGVDWNDTKNGTNIVVMGLNPTTNKFIIVDKATVSRDGWTQLTACYKIAEMNRAWLPMAIYLDTGYGGTQYEVLRKFGYDSMKDSNKGAGHPDSKIPHILKQYDFGSKVETRDLFTGAPVKKDAKPFLVESTVRRFESSDIHFSAYDNDLEKQLLGYVVDRITPTGKPIYKASDEQAGDHTLDAMMLSIMAFVMESTPFGKPRFESKVLFGGSFGERTDPVVHEGDLVVKNRNIDRNQKEREKKRPSMERTNTMEQESLFNSGPSNMPASNMKKEGVIKPWKWNGFLRDESQPRPRTIKEAFGEAQQKQGIKRRRSVPRRKNI